MTPTNEAGHGLPELPEPDFVTPDDNLYTIHTMRRYARDYAAALALSRGVPDAVASRLRGLIAEIDSHRKPATGELRLVADELKSILALAAAPVAAGAQGEEPQWVASLRAEVFNSAMKDVFSLSRDEVAHLLGGLLSCAPPATAAPQPAAADGGVRERATELLAEVYRDSGYLYEAGTLEAGVVDSIDDCALRAIEKALTKPILPSVKTFASAVWRDWMTNEQADKLGAELHAWLSAHFATALSSHRQAGDGRPHVVRIPKEKRWVEGDSEFLKWHADGYNSALSDVMSVNQGVSRLEPSEHPSQDALRKLLPDLIDYAESGKVAEPWMVDKMRAELESLLALVEKEAGS